MIPVPHRMLVSMQSSARLMVGRGALPMSSKTASQYFLASSSPYPSQSASAATPVSWTSPSQSQRRFSSSESTQRLATKAAQSQSPLAPIGVQAALEFAESSTKEATSKGEKSEKTSWLLSPDEENAKPALPPSSKANLRNDEEKPKPKIFEEFALNDRVGIVSGGNRGLGLEMAVALCEAGARAIYCLDLPSAPSSEFQAAKAYLEAMEARPRLEYVHVDVTDQEAVWKRVGEIGDREGRMDVCVAAAGILKEHTDCLRYPARQFKEVMDVNVNGVLYTAQAAGQQMERFGNNGSIILIASMSGTITNRDHAWVSYNTSKSAVLQMARSMACELGKKNIRVNSLSPGHIYTSMTAAYLDKQPHLLEKWSNLNPMGRIGRPDEMRGVCVWLASDASSFCTGSDIIVSGGHHSW